MGLALVMLGARPCVGVGLVLPRRVSGPGVGVGLVLGVYLDRYGISLS